MGFVFILVLSMVILSGGCFLHGRQILSLQDRFDFHTVIFLCPGQTLLISDLFIKQINLPVIFIANSSSFDTKSMLNSNNLFIIIIEEHHQDSRLFWKCISDFAEILRHGKTILWLNYDVEAPFKEIAPYLEYMWTKKVLDVVAMFDSGRASNQIFTYNPFPSFKVQNISSEKDIFSDKLSDLHGFPMTTLIKRDEPRIFKYIGYNGRMKLGGYAGNIFLAFLKKHNATLREYFIPNTTYLNREVLMNLISDGSISISVHPYARLGKATDGSYPIGLMKQCVMMPAPQEIPLSRYLFVAFPAQVWVLLLVSIILILAQILCFNKFSAGKFRVGQTLLETASGIISQSYEGGNHQKSWKQKLIRISVTIFGFFIASFYGSRLASVFVTKLFQPPLETKEDFIQAKLRILMIRVDFEIQRDIIQPQQFRNLVVPVDAEEVHAYRNFFNGSFAYVAPEDKVLFFLLQQKYLKHQLVFYSKVCLTKFYSGFNMPADSPFKNIFNRVLLQTFQSGLYFKWRRDILDETVEAGFFVRTATSENTQTPISVAHLNLAWTVLICGLSSGLVSFLVEIISKRINYGK